MRGVAKPLSGSTEKNIKQKGLTMDKPHRKEEENRKGVDSSSF